jgi:hypothetical protein
VKVVVPWTWPLLGQQHQLGLHQCQPGQLLAWALLLPSGTSALLLAPSPLVGMSGPLMVLPELLPVSKHCGLVGPGSARCPGQPLVGALLVAALCIPAGWQTVAGSRCRQSSRWCRRHHHTHTC